MSIKNGNKIEAPVNPWEVSKVLGIRSGDVGTVCTSPRINPWAKDKPVNHPKIGILTDKERAEAQYGMTNIPLFGSQIDMARFVAPADGDTPPAPLTGTASKYWDYELPPYNKPKRLSDFDGYWHQAVQPIEPLQILNDELDISGMADSEEIYFDFPVATADANLKISDFAFTHLWGKYPNQVTNGTTYFLGLCLTDGKKDGSGTRTVTQGSSMDNGMPNVRTVDGKQCAFIKMTRGELMAAAPPSGLIWVFPFVTDSVKTPLGLAGLESHPAVPFSFAAKQIRLKTGKAYLITFGEIKVTKLAMNGPWEVSVKVNVRNQTDSALGVNTGNQGTISLTGQQERSMPFMPANTVIAPGATLTVEKIFTGNNYQLTQGGDYRAVVQWQPYPGGESYNITSSYFSVG